MYVTYCHKATWFLWHNQFSLQNHSMVAFLNPSIMQQICRQDLQLWMDRWWHTFTTQTLPLTRKALIWYTLRRLIYKKASWRAQWYQPFWWSFWKLPAKVISLATPMPTTSTWHMSKPPVSQCVCVKCPKSWARVSSSSRKQKHYPPKVSSSKAPIQSLSTSTLVRLMSTFKWFVFFQNSNVHNNA